MSQTIVPPAPAGGPPPSVGTSGSSGSTGPTGPSGPPPGTFRARVGSAATTVRHYLDGSPGRLRVVSAIAVLAAILVALGGGAALRERSSALDEARRSAAHLLLVQGVQIQLAEADAKVTNSFLRFGLEPANQQQEYIAAIAKASNDLVIAANATGVDAEALGEANTALTRYTGYIGSARANNREGNPVGANYLTTAGDLLREKAIPQLEVQAATDTRSIKDAYDGAARASWWLVLVGLLGLGGMIGAGVYLARHSRRILNVPLTGAAAGLVLVLLAAAGAMALAQSRAVEVQNGALNDATRLSTSRVAAFSAKSQESLTLIARGSSTAEDADWKKLHAAAVSNLPSAFGEAEAALNAYERKHDEINELDVLGEWDRAVADATSQQEGSANRLFLSYDKLTQDAVQQQAAEISSGLDDAGNTLLPVGILVFLVGLAAAAAAWFGVSLRLDEYR